LVLFFRKEHSCLRFLALLCVSCAQPALAADRAVTLTTPGALRGSIGAMPQIADPADAAEQRIDSALRQIDVDVLKAAEDCKGGDWTRVVDAPMRGPGFLSLVITDSIACDGAAHPETSTAAIVYSLTTGKPVDWTRLLPPSLTGRAAPVEAGGSRFVTLASRRLFALYMAGYTDGGATGDDLRRCKDALSQAGNAPPMNAWLDAKSGGLSLEIELPHAIAACEDVVTIPKGRLRAEGASPALLKALAAARQP